MHEKRAQLCCLFITIPAIPVLWVLHWGKRLRIPCWVGFRRTHISSLLVQQCSSTIFCQTSSQCRLFSAKTHPYWLCAAKNLGGGTRIQTCARSLLVQFLSPVDCLGSTQITTDQRKLWGISRVKCQPRCKMQRDYQEDSQHLVLIHSKVPSCQSESTVDNSGIEEVWR